MKVADVLALILLWRWRRKLFKEKVSTSPFAFISTLWLQLLTAVCDCPRGETAYCPAAIQLTVRSNEKRPVAKAAVEISQQVHLKWKLLKSRCSLSSTESIPSCSAAYRDLREVGGTCILCSCSRLHSLVLIGRCSGSQAARSALRSDKNQTIIGPRTPATECPKC